MLDVRNLSLQTKGGFRLQNLSFEVGTGQMVGILGPNGAGKSTLLAALAQPGPEVEGQIRWNAFSLKEYPLQQLARERAMFTQKTEVSADFTAEQIVLMGRYPHGKGLASPDDHRIADAAMLATETLPFAHRSVRALSGGEQQRIHLARASAQVWEGLENEAQPKLLLLDEPLNNLDIRHQHAALQFARDFAEAGNVVLMVMHDLNLAAMYAHRILMLCEGAQMAYGDPASVLNETLLEHCYRCPVSVQTHPFHACPVVFFRNAGTAAPNTRNQTAR